MPHQENFSLEQTEITTQCHYQWKTTGKLDSKQWIYKTLSCLRFKEHHRRGHMKIARARRSGASVKLCLLVTSGDAAVKSHPHDCPNRSGTKRTLTKQAN